MIHGNGVRAFIGSFTSAGGRGVITADLDQETGALTERAATDAVADPSYLALSPDGRVLYAVSEREDGAAAALDVRPEGDAIPRLLGAPVPVRGSGPTHLALVPGRLLTANYGSGSVSVLPVAADGGLREPVAVFQHTGTAPPGGHPPVPHAHQVVAAPGGRWALCTDLGTDSVRILALSAAGEPAPYGETALRPGTGPRHLAFHPGGRHVYVVGEREPTLTVCRWDATTGVLEPVGETPVLPGGVAGESFPSTVVVSRDGRFVWVAVRGDDRISVLALDAAYEKPEPVTAVDCGGRWPRDLTLDPTGRRLYVANERSGDVTWFDLDPETGVPARAGALAAPAVSCVVFG
ncbi:lactonase family protein [Streptomyces sp. NPDC088258]|uniref:lactonase family protein n=1 Tax=Streptomyces sp. NPDC088258 TaxID=3365849 RepID=UPI0038037B07